nr:MAG TPA: hypothetical protein [Caudoviricetes sp.]
MRSPEVSPSSLDVVIADTWRRAQKRGHSVLLRAGVFGNA